MTSRPAAEPRLRLFIRLACITFSVAALIWIVRRVDVASLREVFERADPRWLMAAWAVFGLGFLAAAARWHLVLKLSRCAVRPWATVRTVLIGHLFNTILFGPTGGDIAKATLYSRWYGFATSGILATCVLDRFLGGVGFFILTAIAPGLAASDQRWSQRAGGALNSPRLALWAGIIALAVLAGFVISRRFKSPSPLRKIWTALVSHGSAMAAKPAVGGMGVLLAVISHLCISGVFIFSLKAVSETPVSVPKMFWVFPVISLITSAPVTFSGAGLREGAALFFFGMYGIAEADAVAASLLVLATYLSWAVVGGLLMLGRQRREGKDRRANSAPPLPVAGWKATPE